MICSDFGRRWAALPSATAAGLILKSYLDTLYASVGSAVTTSRAINTQHSLTGGGNLSADRTLNLVNDTASPGNSKVYGTDGSGVRGWQTLTAPDYGAGNAALGYGAIGTYAFLMPPASGTTTYEPGDTLAGSSLDPFGVTAGSTYSVSINTTSPSGTWRCMGRAVQNTVGNSRYGSLWLRIS